MSPDHVSATNLSGFGGGESRQTGPDDVFMKVLYCGICHTDIHQVKNHLGMSKYPMVPGYVFACH